MMLECKDIWERKESRVFGVNLLWSTWRGADWGGTTWRLQFFQSTGEPVQTLIEAITSKSTSSLNVPHPVPQVIETKPLAHLHGGHCTSLNRISSSGVIVYMATERKKQKQIFIYSTWMHFKIKSSAKPMQGPVEWIKLNIFHLGQIKTPSKLSFNNQISAKTTEYWWFEKSHEEQKLASGRRTYHIQEMAHYSWQNNQQTEESLIEIHEPRFTDDLVPISPWHGS